MKIIKAGRPQKGWSKEFTCTGAGNGMGGCGAVLLVEQDDVFRTASHHYDGSSEYYNTFKCASCGVLTDIKEHLPFRARGARRGEIPGRPSSSDD
jgi:hypothetical protein